MKLIGLTGGIGSGKSTVSAALSERGAVVVDADVIVHELQQPGTAVFEEMVERFGDGIVAPDGSLDRAAVAAIVFDDPEALADLGAIVHPRVHEEIERRVAEQADTDNVVVLDIPLLGEAGWPGLVGTIVVDLDPDVAVERLVAQRGLDEHDARARIARQISREERLSLADAVVDNTGTPEDLAAGGGPGLGVGRLPGARVGGPGRPGRRDRHGVAGGPAPAGDRRDRVTPRRYDRSVTDLQQPVGPPAEPKMVRPFKVVSDFEPAGDQPTAIAALSEGINGGERFQTLLGITGSGKSATMAWTIEQVQRPTLVLAPNKSLAAQLANEFREFFPDNRVEYFVSLLRLLPARGVHRLQRHVHREGLLGQRRDRPAAPLRHRRPCSPGAT